MRTILLASLLALAACSGKPRDTVTPFPSPSAPKRSPPRSKPARRRSPFKRTAAHASAAGGMVFTPDEASWDNGQGIYGRIRPHQAKG
jgi:hypothetical protein